MKIYTIIDGNQRGPFQSEELPTLGLRPDTPVWYKGLENWTPAGSAEATAWLFSHTAAPVQPEPQGAPAGQAVAPPPYQSYQQPYGQSYQQPYTQYQQPYQQPYQQSYQQTYQTPQSTQPKPPRPGNYLVFSLLMLLCCCQPLGIITLILSLLVNNSYESGSYDQARSYSRWALWLNVFGLVGGVLFWVGCMLLESLPFFLTAMFAAVGLDM